MLGYMFHSYDTLLNKYLIPKCYLSLNHGKVNLLNFSLPNDIWAFYIGK
jgi:hypothetical protein